jgi:hypothetical protein
VLRFCAYLICSRERPQQGVLLLCNTPILLIATTRNTQHATHTQHATRNTHATHTQHATRAIRNTQHATRNTQQHAIRNTQQHAIRNTQYANIHTSPCSTGLDTKKIFKIQFWEQSLI